MNKREMGIYERFVKSIIDRSIALCGLIILSPIFLIVAVLVKVKLGSPILFKQARPGKNEKIFVLYKFRTMSNTKDENGRLLSDEERLTSFGKLLRRTSLDELPELINILKGDMAIVGPRPLAVKYLPYYNEVERHRHDVLPGLTGLAQINGRNSLQWEERFAFDLKYIQHINFITDMEIILKTAIKVLKKEDIALRGTTAIMDFDKYRIWQNESQLKQEA